MPFGRRHHASLASREEALVAHTQILFQRTSALMATRRREAPEFVLAQAPCAIHAQHAVFFLHRTQFTGVLLAAVRSLSGSGAAAHAVTRGLFLRP